jgi:hypothetical protein
MDGGQLGRICRAIDELAAHSASADRGAGESVSAASDDGTAQPGAARRDGAIDRTGAAHPAGAARRDGAQGPAGPDGVALRARATGRDRETDRAGRDDADIARLAAIWEMVADADPELAKRLPGYLSAAE